MGDVNGSKWMDVLPWTLLSRRTSYHNELQGTPAQALLGQNPRLPGDLQPQADPELTIDKIMAQMQSVASRPPAQTRPPQEPVHYPKEVLEATHVYVRRPKSKIKPLQPIADGPFLILDRLGTSCLNISTGKYKSGASRTEVVHWRNCVPAILPENTIPAHRPKLGRKSKKQASP